MKKRLLSLSLILLCSVYVHAQRFIDSVFTGGTVTVDTYATNYSVLTGSPMLIHLTMDVYQPIGDTMAHRPLVIILHTGNFLPAIVNQTPEGFRQDSATVELCRRFVKRGYVVANIDYRLGWNPAGTTLDERRGTIINAIYRAVQDVHSCIRYFHKDAATANKYKIDSNKVIIGGHGTGGYVAVNTMCLKDTMQVMIPKFISNTTDAPYGFVAGYPYVNWHVIGDFDGYGGITGYNNPNNSAGYGGDAQFVFNLGGCLGDSSWMTSSLVPIVGFHEPGNPYAPFGHGLVYVPSIPPQSVVDVVGDSVFIRTADAVGNNNCFKQYDDTSHDIYTTHARAVSGNVEGLYMFMTSPGIASPWNWYDSTSFVAEAVGGGYRATYADSIIFFDKLSNPLMGAAYARTFIDTVMGYLCPRIAYSCLQILAVPEVTNAENEFKVYPNPVIDNITVDAGNNKIKAIEIADLAGRIVERITGLNTNKTSIRPNLQTGMYLISVWEGDTRITKKLMVQ